MIQQLQNHHHQCLYAKLSKTACSYIFLCQKIALESGYETFFKCLPIRLNRWWNYTVKHLFVWHQMRSGHLLLVVAFLVVELV